MNPALMLWVDVVVYALFFTSLLFPLIGFYWPWWGNGFGWSTVLFDETIAVAILPSFLITVGVSLTGNEVTIIEASALTAGVFVILWRAIVIYIIQRRGAIADRQPDQDSDRGA